MIDRLYLLRKIELGIAQADTGDVIEHDAFMDELEEEDAKQYDSKSKVKGKRWQGLGSK